MTSDKKEFWIYSAMVATLAFGGALFYQMSGKTTAINMLAVLMVITMYLGIALAAREADKNGDKGEESNLR